MFTSVDQIQKQTLVGHAIILSDMAWARLITQNLLLIIRLITDCVDLENDFLAHHTVPHTNFAVCMIRLYVQVTKKFAFNGAVWRISLVL